MKFTIKHDQREDRITFEGALSFREVGRLNLDGLDMALLEDVGGDKVATADDYLLALEMLFRRHRDG